MVEDATLLNMDLVQHVIGDSKNGLNLTFLIKYDKVAQNLRLSKKGIKWTWQSLDSISIKSPLGGQ